MLYSGIIWEVRRGDDVSFPVTFLKCIGCSRAKWCDVAAAGDRLPVEDHRNTGSILQCAFTPGGQQNAIQLLKLASLLRGRLKKWETFHGNDKRT